MKRELKPGMVLTIPADEEDGRYADTVYLVVAPIGDKFIYGVGPTVVETHAIYKDNVAMLEWHPTTQRFNVAWERRAGDILDEYPDAWVV